MTGCAVIRPAQTADAAAIAGIYNYYVRQTTATLQVIPAREREFSAQIAAADAARPFIVALSNGVVAGYGYADIFKSRCGYQHTYESSVYVAPSASGQGIGAALMEALIAALKSTPAHKLIAIIALPNPASVALHKKFGFTCCGMLPAVGWKFNQWVDSSYWILPLKEGAPGS